LFFCGLGGARIRLAAGHPDLCLVAIAFCLGFRWQWATITTQQLVTAKQTDSKNGSNVARAH